MVWGFFYTLTPVPSPLQGEGNHKALTSEGLTCLALTCAALTCAALTSEGLTSAALTLLNHRQFTPFEFIIHFHHVEIYA